MDKYKKIRNLLIGFCVFMIVALIVVAFLVIFCGVPRQVLQLLNALASATAMGVLIYAIWYNKKKKALDGPEYKAYGKIISKRKETDSIENPLGFPEDWKCYITCQFDDNTFHEFCTTASFYLFAQIGQRGLLTFQKVNNQLKLINFQEILN